MSESVKSKKSWREKLEKAQEPKVVEIPQRMSKQCGSGTMLIPRPLDVDALMRKVSKGKLVTQSEIRNRLAKDSKTDTACPITTGIFIRIAAEAAEEDIQSGSEKATPYWRVIRDDGSLIDKFPGGVASQARRLKDEGFAIEPAVGSKPPKVRDFAGKLIKL